MPISVSPGTETATDASSFDEKGRFIEGYYLVGFLGEAYLDESPRCAKIVHDPRLTWNTMEMVRQAGGEPVMSKAGHAFIKERMRLEDAVYGGEMSAHHYFRDFAYCDSGMIPWLSACAACSPLRDRPLSELVQARIDRYPVSGEINLTVSDPASVIEKLKETVFSRREISFDYH